MKTPDYFKPHANAETPFQNPVVVIASGMTREASDVDTARTIPNFALSKAIDRFERRCTDDDARIADVCGEEVIDLLSRDVPSVPVQIVSPAVARDGKKLVDQNVYSLPDLGTHLLASDFH